MSTTTTSRPLVTKLTDSQEQIYNDDKHRVSKHHGQNPSKNRSCKEPRPGTRPSACDNCRRKKTKCTGPLSEYASCLRARIPCVFRVARRLVAAPRNRYIRLLEQQMRDMQARMLDLTRPTSRAQETVFKAMPKDHGAANSNTPDLDSDDFWRASSLSDYDEWDVQSPALFDFSPSPQTTESPDGQEYQPSEGQEYLPPFDVQEKLSETFFTHVYGQPYFLLHEPSYMAKLRAGILPPILVLTVCGIAARFSEDPCHRMSPRFLSGERWASCARRLCASRLDSPDLTLVTCLCLLSLHDFGTCHGVRSWMLGGQAIRMAFSLRLHREDLSVPVPSFLNTEIRRRIMWACFMLDRFISSGASRPFFIKEETITIPEPASEMCFQQGILGASRRTSTNSASVAAYMVRAVSIWGKIINYLHQGGRDLDPYPRWDPKSSFAVLSDEADTMSTALPASLVCGHLETSRHEAEHTLGQFFFLHITIQQNILALNQAVLVAPTHDFPPAALSCAKSKAIDAASRISRLLAAVGPCPVNSPFVGYAAFSSAMLQLEGNYSSNPRTRASTRRRITANIRYLQRMKRHWGVFHWLIDKLRARCHDLFNRARQRMSEAAYATEAPCGQKIGEYGEWHDRYPREVSRMNFVEPMETKAERGDGDGDGALEQKPYLITVDEYLSRTASPHHDSTAGLLPQDLSDDVDSDNELHRLLTILGDDSTRKPLSQDATSSSSEQTCDTQPTYHRDTSSSSDTYGTPDPADFYGNHVYIEDPDLRDGQETLEAWAKGLDILSYGIETKAPRQESATNGFEGCEALSFLQQHMV